MEKKGGALLVVGIVILSLVIFGVGAGIYFYNFYVFKTVRICLGEAENTGIPCNSSSDCDFLSKTIGQNADLKGLPEFARESFQKVMNKAVYCDGSCRVKNIRGIDKKTHELKFLDSCKADEEEITIEIHGKEGLEILNYLRMKKT